MVFCCLVFVDRATLGFSKVVEWFVMTGVVLGFRKKDADISYDLRGKWVKIHVNKNELVPAVSVAWLEAFVREKKFRLKPGRYLALDRGKEVVIFKSANVIKVEDLLLAAAKEAEKE